MSKGKIILLVDKSERTKDYRADASKMKRIISDIESKYKCTVMPLDYILNDRQVPKGFYDAVEVECDTLNSPEEIKQLCSNYSGYFIGYKLGCEEKIHIF